MFKRKTPSAGFFFLLLVLLGNIIFFSWGMREPRLESLWVLQTEAIKDINKLSTEERNKLREAAKRSPELREEWLERGLEELLERDDATNLGEE